MTAVDVLAETGTRKDASMRHFTGGFPALFPFRPLTGFQSTLGGWMLPWVYSDVKHDAGLNIPQHTACYA